MDDGRKLVANTIEVESLTVFDGLLDAQLGGQIGDFYDEASGNFTKPPTPSIAVPASVTRRQARQALLLAGQLHNVQPAIDAIPDPTQRALAQIEWDDSLEFERQRPLVIAIGSAIGCDAAALDALFISAAGL
ncbi:hypothetical protein ASC94_09250 [Massilia sp. Root418]|nr:hypothetical protein ASC94_09250 [Massilia sp. Root418]